MANLGYMLVDFEVLREALRLPEGTLIVDAAMRADGVSLTIESDDFPETKAGFALPTVDAIFAPGDDGCTMFVDWEIH